MKYGYTVIIGIVATLVIVGGMVFLTDDKLSLENERNDFASIASVLKNTDSLTNGEMITSGEGSIGATDASEENASTVMLTQTYVNKQFGFTFNYPSRFTVGNFEEGEGEIILVQNKNGAEYVQLYIAPFDEGGVITPERILEDLPDLGIKNPQQVVIASGALQALIFISDTEEFGRAREVWFIYGGQLFQVITPVENEQLVGSILESFKF